MSLYTLHASGAREIIRIEKPACLPAPRLAAKDGEKPPPNILFLRGQPSSEWLSTVGALYRVDPEFFQRHLDFRSTIGRLNYFSLPSLPSVSGDIIRLRFITIGQQEAQAQADQDAIEALRQAGTKSMTRYLHNLNLSIETDSGLGNSMVRVCSIFDQTHFAIEQNISICISRNNGGWTGEFSRDPNPLCYKLTVVELSCGSTAVRALPGFLG